MAAPKIPDLSGTTIGEYEIVTRLGVGGMGVVYEGKHPVIGKRVAVKVLLPQLSYDQDLVERFVSEARAVNEIGHRGIVDIFSFGQLPTGEHYFVMELLNGTPFDRIIKTRAPVPAEEALWWGEEIAEALQAAHEAGIIHRDIKPSNLFLVDTGRGKPYVKLLDFGIAKLGAREGESTPQTRASMVVGTPDYMSPEQARGKPITPATDVYALGCVMFELVTGKRPFKGENALETMFMHVENDAPRASTVLPGIDPKVEHLLLWTMEKDPGARPTTAEALRAQIAEIRKFLPEVMMAPRPSPARGSLPGLSPSGRMLPIAATPRPPNTGSRAVVKIGGEVKSSQETQALPRAIPVDLTFTGEHVRVPLGAEDEQPIAMPLGAEEPPAAPLGAAPAPFPFGPPPPPSGPRAVGAAPAPFPFAPPPEPAPFPFAPPPEPAPAPFPFAPPPEPAPAPAVASPEPAPFPFAPPPEPAPFPFAPPPEPMPAPFSAETLAAEPPTSPSAAAAQAVVAAPQLPEEPDVDAAIATLGEAPAPAAAAAPVAAPKPKPKPAAVPEEEDDSAFDEYGNPKRSLRNVFLAIGAVVLLIGGFAATRGPSKPPAPKVPVVEAPVVKPPEPAPTAEALTEHLAAIEKKILEREKTNKVKSVFRPSFEQAKIDAKEAADDDARREVGKFLDRLDGLLDAK